MGYSNVAGDLNVYSSTSTQTLTVRSDTTLSGNLAVNSGTANFKNVVANTLTVTGNFIITATNTQATNALSINNIGTATALKVVQYEGGGGGHIYNVAEFWDYLTLAMVIDPEGNVGIHTTSSPGYALTVKQGALFDNLTASYFIGDGSNVTNIQAVQVTGGLSGYQLQTAQSNITSLGTLTSLSVAGPILSAGGNTLSNLNTANVTIGAFAANQLQTAQGNITSVGTLTSLSVAGPILSSGGNTLSNLNTANVTIGAFAANQLQTAQTNITSVGTLTSLAVTGVTNSGWFSGSGNTLSNLNTANVTIGAFAANQLQTAQTNITSVGTLTSLAVTGVTNSGWFVGSGNTLSNLNTANVTIGAFAANQLQTTQTNITSVGTLTSLAVTGVTTSGWFSGSGNTLSNLNTANVVIGAFAANQLQTAQTNITSVGTLTSLAVTGATTSGWFSGSGNTLSNLNTANVIIGAFAANQLQAAQTNITSVGTLTSLSVAGPIISEGGNTLSNLNTANVTIGAFAANQLQAAQTNITSVGTLTSLAVTGVTTSGWFSGSGNTLSNLNTANVTIGAFAANQLQAAQTNITSVGTLTSLSVTGSSAAGWFVGSGNTISNLNTANVTIGAFAANQLQAAQGNITSVGILTSLNVSGTANINTLNVATGSANLLTANIANIYTTNIVGFIGSQWVGVIGNPIYYQNSNVGIGTSTGINSNLTVAGNAYISNSITTANTFTTNLTVTGSVNFTGAIVSGGGNVLSNINASNVAFGALAPTQLQSAQTNITSVGTLTSLAVTGVTTSGWFSGSGNTLSNLNASNVIIGAFSASQLQAAQTNITSVGTLTSLAVSGPVSTTNNVYAANALQTANILATSLTSNSTNTNITSTLNISSLLVNGTTAGLNQTLITTGTGAGVQWGTIIGSQWTTGTGNIYYISNVGIGTSAVSANLSVAGNIYASNALQTSNIISAGFTSNSTNVNVTGTLSLQTVLATNYGGTGADGSAVTANKFLGSPSGSTGGVTYRVLASADLPTVSFSPGAAGTYGSSTSIPTIVVDTYGRITGISTSSITTLSGLTTNGVLYATSATTAGSTATGTTGQPLLSGGTGAAPSYGTLSIAYGGTGQTTQTTAFNALSPMTTLGDLIYGGASGSGTRLAGSTSTTISFLSQTGTGTISAAPVWTSSTGTGSVVLSAGPTLTGTVVMTGSVGATTLQVTGNIYASNSLVTNNVIATGTISGAWNGTSQGILLTLGTNLATGTSFSSSSDVPVLQAYHVPLQSFTQNAVQAVSNYTITAQGLIKFSSTGLYQLVMVFVMDSPVVKVALGTNSTSSLPVTTSAYTYVYTVSSAASPSDAIIIPINVQNISNYYYIDIFCRSSSTSGTYYLTTGTNVSGSQNGTYIQIAPFGNYVSTGQNASAGLLLTTSGATLPTPLAQVSPLTSASNTYHVTMTSGAGWTTTGTSPIIQMSPNGNFQFLQAGVYNVTVCFNPSVQTVMQVGIGSTSTDAALPATIGPYIYQYAPTYTQDPSTSIMLPIPVTDTTKYYYLDATFGPSTSVTLLSTSTFISVAPLASYLPSPMATSSIVVSQVVTAQSTSYTALSTDSYIGMSNGGTVTMPQGSTLTRGKMYTIKEESGKAGTNQAYNVIIQMSGLDTIDGQSNAYIQVGYTSVNLMWTGANNRWVFV